MKIRECLEIAWIIVFLMVCGFLMGIHYANSFLDIKKFVLKSSFVGLFKQPAYNTFNCGEHLMTDQNGNTKFYPAKDVDALIEKINKLIKE